MGEEGALFNVPLNEPKSQIDPGDFNDNTYQQ
jgi:hypothetical protein